MPELIEFEAWNGDSFPPWSSLPPTPVGYFLIVARSALAMYESLKSIFASDPKVTVLLDRRRSRRASSPFTRKLEDALSSLGVAVVRRPPAMPGARSGDPYTHPKEEGTRMDEMEVLDERQRVDRWLEESQYLIGRLLPGFLDDRERLKAKLETGDQERERLCQEISDLRKEIGALQAELHFCRTEQASMAETFAGIIDHINQLHKPVNDLYRRLQTPNLSEATS